MSILSYLADDLFIVRVIKSLGANPDNRWANSYELKAGIAGSADELLAVALRIEAFERALHTTAVEFRQLLVSTWSPDSVPYNPETFISLPLSSTGQRVPDSDLLPLSATLSLTRVAVSGRFGHVFLRGCLTEEDVITPAGKQVFADSGQMNSRVQTAMMGSNLQGNIGASPSSSPFLVMISKTGGQVRNVVGLVAQGVSQVPNDHAWFNRAIAVP